MLKDALIPNISKRLTSRAYLAMPAAKSTKNGHSGWLQRSEPKTSSSSPITLVDETRLAET